MSTHNRYDGLTDIEWATGLKGWECWKWLWQYGTWAARRRAVREWSCDHEGLTMCLIMAGLIAVLVPLGYWLAMLGD